MADQPEAATPTDAPDPTLPDDDDWPQPVEEATEEADDGTPEWVSKMLAGEDDPDDADDPAAPEAKAAKPADDPWELKAYDQTETVTDEARKRELAQKGMAWELKADSLKQTVQQAKGEAQEAKQKLETEVGNLRNFVSQFQSTDPEMHVKIYDAIRQFVPNAPSFTQVVEAYVDKMLALNNMPAAERARIQYEQQQQALQAERQRMTQQHRSKEMEFENQRAFEHLSAELPKAMEAAGLQRSAPILRRCAEVWALALDEGLNPTALQVAQAVHGERQRDREADLASIVQDGKIDLATLPKPLIEAVVAAELEKRKAAKAPRRYTPTNSAAPRGEYLTPREWRERRR